MKKLMLGNEAIARGAYEARCGVVSAYPGTPSTEITEYVSKYGEIYSEWAPNEKAALEAAVGASVAGARAMCAMKHVGLNVAADPLFTASYIGVNGGLVVCVADDPGMHSSQNEQDSRNYAKAAKLPMLEPSDSGECKSFLRKAFDLSEEYDTPVLLRLSTRISHSRSVVEEEERADIPLKKYRADPMKYVMMPAMARRRHAIVEERMGRLAAYAEECEFNKIEYGDKKIGFICGGTTYNYAKEAFGEGASYLKLGMTYPLPSGLIKEFAQNVTDCYCVEELDPFIEDFCRALGIKIHGKELFTPLGEYSPEMIYTRAAGADYDPPTHVIKETLPGRPPVMCAGCPHRATFTAIKQLGLNVCGDIGCYTLAATPVLNSLHTCLCMGASIGMAHGMDKASPFLSEPVPKTVAVIGDSTFIHTGVAGLVNAVYNRSAITVVILDNLTTGMTGHQDHPATGRTIKGEQTVRVDIASLCRACGVNRVSVIDPFDLEKMKAALKEETASDEVSVIIAERPCVLLKSVAKSERNMIDEHACKKCLLCMRIGCPAITRRGGGVSIDGALCVGCGFCKKICRFGAIVPERRDTNEN